MRIDGAGKVQIDSQMRVSYAVMDSSFAERMQVTQGGKVGIGCAPSNYAFDVANVSGGNYARFGDGTNDFGGYISAGKAHWGTLTNTPFALMINGAEKVTLDPSGNVGIGIAPSASSLPTIESQYGILVGRSNSAVAANAYYATGDVWKRVSLGSAT